MKNSSRSAFTLLELLVVIAIVGILVAVVMPVFARTRENATRTKCASNLKQVGTSLLLASQDRNGQFPAADQQVGVWPWDVPRDIVDPLVNQYGADRNIFYCPAQPEMNKDDYWEYGGKSPAGTYRIIGYVFLMKNVAQVPDVRWQINMYSNPMPEPMKIKRGIPAQTEAPAPKVELVVDATLSQGGNYTNVTGGLKVNRTNHMDGKNKFPLGANILFKDFHVEWRDFSKMDPAEKFGDPQFQY